MTDGWDISCKIALRWMPLDLTDDKSTLVHVMAWCRQATSHYPSQCWPRSMSPYGVSRPWWVKCFIARTTFTCMTCRIKVTIKYSVFLLSNFHIYSLQTTRQVKIWMLDIPIWRFVNTCLCQFYQNAPFQYWPHTCTEPSLVLPWLQMSWHLTVWGHQQA